MTKRRKICVLVALLLAVVVIWASGATFSWTRDAVNTTTSATYGSSTRSGAELVSDKSRATFSKLVIVVPDARGGERRLQEKVASELQSALENKNLVYTMRPRKGLSSVEPSLFHSGDSTTRMMPSGPSWSSTTPVVSICSTREEATQLHPDLLIFVRCKKWGYSFLPFSKSYKAEVEIRGMSPSGLAQLAAIPFARAEDADARFAGKWPEPGVDRFLDYSFGFNVVADGQMKGIFSANHLTSTVAKSIAQKAATDVDEYVKKQVDGYIEQQSKNGWSGLQ